MTFRLKRLKVLQFRNVRAGTDLSFSSSHNILLGRNASGKTTLLDLIAAASSGDFEAFREESFHIEYQTGGYEHESNKGAEGTVSVTLKHVVASSERAVGEGQFSQERISYETHVSIKFDLIDHYMSSAEVLRISLSTLGIHDDEGYLAGTIPVATENPLNIGERVWDAVELFQWEALRGRLRALAMNTLMFGHNVCRFDEALDYFSWILGDVTPTTDRFPKVFWLVPLDSNVKGIFGNTPFKTQWTYDNPAEMSVVLRANFDACPYISRIVSMLGFASCTAVYPIVERFHGAKTHAKLGPPTISLNRADGTSVSVRRLSFGQKRLFSFSWYLEQNHRTCVVDELVNGLHYGWIEGCVDMMHGMQAFVTAQNPLLVDQFAFQSPADVTQCFVLCRVDLSALGLEEFVWVHPSEHQAAEFFRAYENGILHVHEILQTEGLW